MESLSKYVPEKAHVLFGAAVDPSMEDQLSITLVSSLPEERLRRESGVPAAVTAGLEPSVGFAAPEEDEDDEPATMEVQDLQSSKPENPFAGFEKGIADLAPEPEPEPVHEEVIQDPPADTGYSSFADPVVDLPETAEEAVEEMEVAAVPAPVIDPFADPVVPPHVEAAAPVDLPPLPDPAAEDRREEKTVEKAMEAAAKAVEEEADDAPFAEAGFKRRPPFQAKRRIASDGSDFAKSPDDLFGASPEADAAPSSSKKKNPGQPELSFDGGPKGRFEGADPSMIDGEDLDVPPFLRRRR